MTSRYQADVGTDAQLASDTAHDEHALELAICNDELTLKSLLLDNLSDGMFAYTLDGHMVYANQRAAEMLGYTISDFMALPPWSWVLPDHRKQISSLMSQIEITGDVVFESRCVDHVGRIVCVEISSRIIEVEPWGHLCVSVSRDSSARIAAQETMQRLAFFDSLTGLSNRAMLEDRIRAALTSAQANGDTVGVIYMDLDDFKPVNDTHGHAVGDHVLGIVGERLLSCVRESDTVARVGGDEFIALIPRLSSRNDLSRKARELAECISKPIRIGDITVNVTVSVGLATYRPGEHHDELICRADHAMYRAKMQGLAGWEEFLTAV
ncbi:MAG: sensor domain-containing diguanylate cyclase [Coriobacteriia bacterium]|nr:sensor domain-containing diguanylate cyclase [Coriobacteriia bacterium]